MQADWNSQNISERGVGREGEGTNPKQASMGETWMFIVTTHSLELKTKGIVAFTFLIWIEDTVTLKAKLGSLEYNKLSNLSQSNSK